MGRKRRTAGKITTPQKLSHRLPPKPVSYYESKPGHCRMCGEVVLKKDGTPSERALWHQGVCIEKYLLIYQHGYARKQVWKRDRGDCAQCHKKCRKGEWQMDHILPLYQNELDLNDWSYWEMSNLQTLCTNCHTVKCKHEAAHRAELRKEQKEKINIETGLSAEELEQILGELGNSES